MMPCNRKTRVLSVSPTLVLCAMIADATMAAPPTLQSIAVVPASRSIDVGQKLLYTATGTFSDGSAHVLGPAIRDIALGENETCVLLASGGVKCWGADEYGQLGDGSTVVSLAPRRVKGVANATAVAERYNHGCAVLLSGAAKCWGANGAGQLGNGTLTASTSVRVTGITSASAIAVGWFHSCARLNEGTVRCWGSNVAGQLGDGTNVESRVPVPVAGISTATAVATGWYHSCALLASGAVQCWGVNHAGQLGNGTTTWSNTPVPVVGISSATAIAVGGEFSCALLASGAVQCWGNGDDGALGDGSSEPYANSSIPVSVALTSPAVAITAGEGHACAVLSSGAARCWGRNEYGQLGSGLTTAQSSSTPVGVSGINSPVRIAAGGAHTCALLPDGAMRCWGADYRGQLGDRRMTARPIRWPVNVVGTPGVMWESSDPSKATISDRGRATGRSIGNTTISATTAGFLNGNAVLTVK